MKEVCCQNTSFIMKIRISKLSMKVLLSQPNPLVDQGYNVIRHTEKKLELRNFCLDVKIWTFQSDGNEDNPQPDPLILAFGYVIPGVSYIEILYSLLQI